MTSSYELVDGAAEARSDRTVARSASGARLRAASSKDIPLEALRGLAALTVLLWHTMLGFLPARSGIFPELDASKSLATQAWYGLIYGPAAVDVFFVLSGYVLVRSYFLSGDIGVILRGAVKRYPRLAGPVLLVVLISWLLFAVGAYHYGPAGAITKSPWLSAFAYGINADFRPHFGTAFLQGAFFTFVRGDASYDSSLWTMRYELIGSFLVFGLALIVRPLRTHNVWAAAGVVAVAVLACYHQPKMVAFPVGLALALLLPARRLHTPWPIALVAGMLAIYALGFSGTAAGAYRPFAKMVAADMPVNYVHVAAAVILIYLLETTPGLRRAASLPWAAWLGRISFPLYLIHVLVLCSLGAGVLVTTMPLLPPPFPHVLAAMATILGSLIAAVPFAAFNDAWVGWVNRWTRAIVADVQPNYAGAAGRVEPT